MPDREPFDEFLSIVQGFSAILDAVPGWTEWRRSRLSDTLWFEQQPDGATDFEFPAQIQADHDFMTAIFNLWQSWAGLADVEHYFRRFPFEKRQVTHANHFRYCCESYFSRVYEFSERLKKALDQVQRQSTLDAKAAGALIKEFKQDFDQEIRARHDTHHHQPFDEYKIGRLTVLGLLAATDTEKGWGQEHQIAYRAATKEWAERVRRRSKRVKVYLDSVLSFANTNTDFAATYGPRAASAPNLDQPHARHLPRRKGR